RGPHPPLCDLAVVTNGVRDREMFSGYVVRQVSHDPVSFLASDPPRPRRPDSASAADTLTRNARARSIRANRMCANAKHFIPIEATTNKLGLITVPTDPATLPLKASRRSVELRPGNLNLQGHA